MKTVQFITNFVAGWTDGDTASIEDDTAHAWQQAGFVQILTADPAPDEVAAPTTVARGRGAAS